MTRHQITRHLPCPTCDGTMTRTDLSAFVTCAQGHRTLAGRLIPTLAADEALRLLDANGNLSPFNARNGRGDLVAVAR